MQHGDRRDYRKTMPCQAHLREGCKNPRCEWLHIDSGALTPQVRMAPLGKEKTKLCEQYLVRERHVCAWPFTCLCADPCVQNGGCPRRTEGCMFAHGIQDLRLGNLLPGTPSRPQPSAAVARSLGQLQLLPSPPPRPSPVPRVPLAALPPPPAPPPLPDYEDWASCPITLVRPRCMAGLAAVHS